jgi:hypothetical protein
MVRSLRIFWNFILQLIRNKIRSIIKKKSKNLRVVLSLLWKHLFSVYKVTRVDRMTV